MSEENGLLAAGLLALLILLPSSSCLAANIHVGSLDIHPYVTVSAGHTDNVFLTRTNEESDTFYLISPGIKVFLPIQRHSFNLDYTVDSYIYKERDEADRTIHNVTGTADLNPSTKLNLQLRNTFSRSADIPDFMNDRTSPFIWNRSSFEGAYDVTSRLAFGVDYQHGTKRYDRTEDRIDDYDENGVSGRVYYKVLPKTSLLIFYQYSVKDYEKRRPEDNDAHRVEGGVTWKIGLKSLGTARVGYMRTDYDDINRTDEALSYFVNLTHELRPKTILALEGLREILDTSNADDNLAFSNSYVSTQIAGTVSHGYRKFTGRLKAGYIWDEYLHDDLAVGRERRDNLFSAEVGIDYALRKWFNLGGSYRFSRLDSNNDPEEYEENTYLFYLSLIL
ncbi:MAG: outer membrane beta-barrel protein [Proteobacteria bacterium]|nr:outer membrane beta-barrel protein [Pseudomonadota bacterium]